MVTRSTAANDSSSAAARAFRVCIQLASAQWHVASLLNELEKADLIINAMKEKLTPSAQVDLDAQLAEVADYADMTRQVNRTVAIRRAREAVNGWAA